MKFGASPRTGRRTQSLFVLVLAVALAFGPGLGSLTLEVPFSHASPPSVVSRALSRTSSGMGNVAAAELARPSSDDSIPSHLGIHPTRPPGPLGPAVSETLVLANNTLVSGNFLPVHSGDPTALVADPSLGDLFVASFDLSAVEVVSIATDSVMANISVGVDPAALALVAPTGQLWVANYGSANVSVISLWNDSIAATLEVGLYPDGLVFDPGVGDVFVANSGSNNVSVFNGTTDAVVATIPGFQAPEGMVYVASQAEVFVADSTSHNVSVVRDSDDQVAAVLAVSGSPGALTLDPALGEVFAPSWETSYQYTGSNRTPYANVSVISVLNVSVVATFELDDGTSAAAFDNLTNETYFDENEADEVAIVSDASVRVVANVTVGESPEGVALDPDTGDVFVLNGDSNDISVLVNNIDSATLGLGISPSGSALDNETGDLYVADPDGNGVLVVSTVTNEIVTTIAVGEYPTAVTFDNRSGDLFVADSGSNQVSVLSGATESLLTTVPVGSYPIGLASDPDQGLVFVANFLSSNVSVISTSTDELLTTIPVGAGPDSLVFDPANLQIYVAEAEGWETSSSASVGGVAEISAVTESVDGNVSEFVYFPGDIVYDSRTGMLYVDQGSFLSIRGPSEDIYLISTSSNQIVATLQDPTPLEWTGPMAYVNSTGEIEFASAFGLSGSVGELSDFSNEFGANAAVGIDPQALTWDAAADAVYVSNFEGGSLSVLDPGNASPTATYPATFVESGLPATNNWTVTVGDDTWWVSSQEVSFPEVNGTYTFSIESTSHYDVPYPSGGTFTIAGQGVTETITFGLPRYNLTFVEEALPPDTVWSVTLNGSEQSSDGAEIDFQEPNGDYNFTVAVSQPDYVPLPRSGEVIISDGGPLEIIQFSLQTYSLTFSESGLASGTLWSVQGAGTTLSSRGAAITLSEPNGTYNFTVGTVPGHEVTYDGRVTVQGGAVAVAVSFTPIYRVEFFEVGLPLGTSWSASLGSNSSTSSGTMIDFDATNGSYPFTITPVANYTNTDPNGTIIVNGATVGLQVLFASAAPSTFELTFSETGLPEGTNWSVAVGGMVYYAATSSFSLPEMNGTYAYSVGVVAGYSSTPGSGTITLAGGPLAISIAFSETSGGSGPFGASAATVWWTVEGALLVLIILISALSLRRRRRGAERLSAPPPAAAVRPSPESPEPPGEPAPNANRWNAPK